MKTYLQPEKTRWAEIIRRPVINPQALESQVAAIMAAVQEQGDAALAQFSWQFDRYLPNAWEVAAVAFAEAEQQLTAELKTAIQQAANNIRLFHQSQLSPETVVETMPGVRCWRESRPIDRVGLYIPGGTAPLFSSILMLAIPARLAGCRELVLCTPPGPNGQMHPAMLYAARICGVDRVFTLGGAQAIAAMTFGTESIPAVDKIFGPGNQYVTTAKQLAQRHGVAIDLPAGPSELAILADDSADPAFVAADLLSQAEHGSDSQVLLVSTSAELLTLVKTEIAAQIPRLPRRSLAEAALQHARMVYLPKLSEALALLNTYAPEHLILNCRNAASITPEVRNAGSVFIGPYSCESAGDYASGTNHTLPTNGFARAYSGVSVDSFVKKITFQELSAAGAVALGPTVECLAAAEQLEAHRYAMWLRRQKVEATA